VVGLSPERVCEKSPDFSSEVGVNWLYRLPFDASVTLKSAKKKVLSRPL
jgi:hypothetical protein